MWTWSDPEPGGRVSLSTQTSTAVLKLPEARIADLTLGGTQLLAPGPTGLVRPQAPAGPPVRYSTCTWRRRQHSRAHAPYRLAGKRVAGGSSSTVRRYGLHDATLTPDAEFTVGLGEDALSIEGWTGPSWPRLYRPRRAVRQVLELRADRVPASPGRIEDGYVLEFEVGGSTVRLRADGFRWCGIEANGEYMVVLLQSYVGRDVHTRLAAEHVPSTPDAASRPRHAVVGGVPH